MIAFLRSSGDIESDDAPVVAVPDGVVPAFGRPPASRASADRSIDDGSCGMAGPREDAMVALPMTCAWSDDAKPGAGSCVELGVVPGVVPGVEPSVAPGVDDAAAAE